MASSVPEIAPDTNRFICPYCGSREEPQAQTCGGCGRQFPWNLHLEKVYEELKEREPNRIRATATLVQEAFNAFQGGKPVSMAALKGFVTSWILPRTVVVIGSVVGGLLLAAQTFILWNQTRLLDQQTRAAQTEQVVKLRERIATLNLQATAVARLRQSYLPEIALPACSSVACTSATVRKTLADLREDTPLLPAPDVAKLLLSLSEQLAAMSSSANKIVRQPELRISDKEQANNIAVVTELIRPASTQCLLEPAKVAAMIDRANAFALLSDNSFWLNVPLGRPREFVESAAKFPQIRNNTQMGLISYESAIPSIRTLTNPGQPTIGSSPDTLPDEYKVTEFVRDTTKLKALLLTSIEDLINACSELTEQDKSALEALQPTVR